MDNAIGIDIGYGSTKTYNGSGGRIFPTAITSMVPEETFGEVRPIEVNGEKFLVGEDVLSKWVIDTRRIGFLGSNAWLASLAQAIVTNGLDPEDMDGKKIVLGVPPGHYSKNTARKLTNVINSSIFNYNGKHYELAGAEVLVIPQGTGIYFAYQLGGPDGSIAEKNIAVVDIGHYTIDMVFFAKGRYIEGTASSQPLGVSLLLDDIRSAFYRQYGWAINHQTAQKLLHAREIVMFQDVYRLEQITNILQAYSSKIAETIDGYYESLPSETDIGIAGGGGVLALKGCIKLQHKMFIVADPVTANAKGYYHYGAGR
ncbi:MAG TPA: ParM/StbA family protein [Syntrophorhabdaceae bacterium]|jgi:actin-like ATPase involved in cell morphogenesis|nr:ParM/StbA family protein [Syntrophorhabdaceae bacterium]HQM82258.1 ParM/StbA family protein [Syntrophorhabdaceae bacterium]